jgi:hypothetical protein
MHDSLRQVQQNWICNESVSLATARVCVIAPNRLSGGGRCLQVEAFYLGVEL